MPQYGDIIAKKLFDYLKDTGLTQSAFGAPVGLEQPVVNRVLKGKLKNPEFETLVAIATGMRMEVWELLKPPNTPELQKTGPKLVVDSTSSLLGDAVRLLAGLDDHELRTVLPYIETAPELAATTRLSQNKKLSQDGS